MRGFLVLLLALGGPVTAQENRLWFVDLELEGPLEEVVLDCGSAGRTQLRTGMVAGERRSVAVPVPARVPLGVESLSSHPLPVLRTTGSGTAAVRSWSPEQPTSRVDVLVRLLARPRPVAPANNSGPNPAAAGLALAAFFAVFGLRRRPRLALAVGGLGCVLAVGASELPFNSGYGPFQVELHEAEVGAPLGLVINGAWDQLPLPAGRLEVRPAGRALELELRLEDGVVVGFARAPGDELLGLETEPAPDLEARNNGFEHFDEAWIRGTDGSWSSRGTWERGEPLPAATEDEEREPAPPGWLTAGLPPGRGVLVGQLSEFRIGNAWIRVAGFQERD